MRGTSPAKCAWLIRLLMLASLVGGIVGLATPGTATAQSASAGLSGTVVDNTGAVISGATVIVTHDETSAQRQTKSGADGSFVLSTLAPGSYVVTASHDGFRPTELRNVVLNVDDRLALRLELDVAAMGESLTVVSETQRINTSPAVSTVVDRKFVENLPLNGRSFQALIELTPGVVLTSANTAEEGGQFSVNGQRTSDNYFMVDGVSANAGASISRGGLPGSASSGQLPALTAQGGTNGLVSVDALEEFRLQTSGYAPEFGRVPGGQISLVTRSGTNVFHGSGFEYFRHNALDATDWFVKRGGAQEAKLRQHNFGGVLGGPILRNRTFAFGSYEGLRLLLPLARNVTVPTLELRQRALPALQPYLDAMPRPTGPDSGTGFADFLAVYSDPSELQSASLRVDHNVAAFRLFGRFSNASSFSETRTASYGYASVTRVHSRSSTMGSTWVMSNHLVHDLRVNIATGEAPTEWHQRSIGGSAELATSLLTGRDPRVVQFGFTLQGGGSTTIGTVPNLPVRQFNLVSSITRTWGSHESKVGVDLRRNTATLRGGTGTEGLLFDAEGLRTGTIRQLSLVYGDDEDRTVAFDNISLYAQDYWRAMSRLTLSYGVRWDVLPSPEVLSGAPAVTLDRTDNLYDGSVRLTGPGSDFWRTTYTDFAPRLGVSYVISEDSETPIVLKGGVGMFYGLGYGQAANAFGSGYPYSVARNQANVQFPLSAELLTPPIRGVDAPGQLWVMDDDLEQPYTLQWSLLVDHGFGRHQRMSIGYVGADGHRLLKIDRYRLSLREWPSAQTTVQVSRNLGYSDYHALQMQFQQRLRRGLQAVASYTFGRSRDTGSSDASTGVPAERLPPALDYGYSSFDVRHVFSGALTYQVPSITGPQVWRLFANNWGIDLMVRARSGMPINIAALVNFPPDTQAVRPDVRVGEPFWLDDPSAPGGRRLNRNAFVIPPPQTQGNLTRGSVRGFSLSQVDLALRRDIRLKGDFRLQFRFEAFNLLNTPNFANPNGSLVSPSFGLSASMLGTSLGGQNALYQIGGPRSVQLASKFIF